MAPVSLVDLTTKRGRDLLASWLKNPRVVGVFLAPPCGTASRARSIKLKRKRNAPEPLRDDDNPNGLKSLSFVNKMKISQANKLYHLTSEVVKYAVKHGMIVCVENPQFSLFWATTFWISVAKLLRYTIFHSCQYGSNRQKKTMLAHNHKAFNQLSKLCPGESKKHRHLPWGITPAGHFATSEETAYPIQLARDVAQCFTQALVEAGMKLPPSQLQDMTSSSCKQLEHSPVCNPNIPSYHHLSQNLPPSLQSKWQKTPHHPSHHIHKSLNIVNFSALYLLSRHQ